MCMKKLLDFDSSTEDIIKYISTERNIKETKNYLELKSELVEMYEKTEESIIKQEQEVYKYKRIALEATNPENLTIGGATILAILATILSVIISIFYKEEQDLYSIIFISFLLSIFILATLVFMFILVYRIKDKPKKIVYYQIMDEVILESLKQKEFNKTNEGFKEYKVKIKEIG